MSHPRPVHSRQNFTAILTCFASLVVIPAATNAAPFVLKPLLPPPAQTPNVVPLTPGEQLGKDIFYDHTLSQPEGYSCATCHIPETGFTGPSSPVNIQASPVSGVVPGRVGRRKPQAIAYATYSPAGPYLNGGEGGTYLGGTFWDGRTPDTATQARMPFLDQNEMANVADGPYPPHAGGYSPLVAHKLRQRPYTALFQRVFGRDVFQTSTDEQIYDLMTSAIAMYEASAEINQFSSKYDASTNGIPGRHPYKFTPSEQRGYDLFFGAAQCSQCHSSAPLDPVSDVTQGRETFTMYCYANIGVPANPENPYYHEASCDSDPEGCNPLGVDFIDYGLGANPNPAPDGTLFMTDFPGDIRQFRGLFKAPSLRNVDLRPYPGFVKSYMHNGVFKSLAEVVHFYNKRNIATNALGDEVSVISGFAPPPGYTAIFPPPEVLDNLQNSSGYAPGQTSSLPPPPDDNLGTSFNGQVGHLGLTARQEADLVNFLETLTDGYTRPNPLIEPPCLTAAGPPDHHKMRLHLDGKAGHQYLIQTSTNLVNWLTVSTNILAVPSGCFTNDLITAGTPQFWRALDLPDQL